jgi:pectate lyase
MLATPPTLIATMKSKRFTPAVLAMAALLSVTTLGGAPEFGLVGFASLNAMGQNGTTGGSGGPRVQVTTLAELVHYSQTNTPLMVEVMNDIDLSPLANANQGFPTNYPTGEILVNSNKTLYSKYGAAIRRGSLRIGKGPNGKHNIIIRNLKFRDLWVLDPSGAYDQYGWDCISIEAGSHHVWVDHCDFEQVYDGMVDIKGGSDFVTVSWNVFRLQKKCSLVGASDSASAAATDRGHLNVTFHHNWYDRVEERIPRMRFGNAHVFNLYCNILGGRGIQSTAEAATLVENVYFFQPRSGSRPTVEENGGPTGTVKVVNSTIVNLPGVNVQFRQFGESNFTFNAPFAGPTPPYPYTLDPTGDVPNVVTNQAGVGKIAFELWQMEHFAPEQLSLAAVSGRSADPDGDGSTNEQECLAGTNPWAAASALRMTAAEANGPDLQLRWSAAGPRTNILQSSDNLTPASFFDIGDPIPILVTGDAAMSMTVLGGASNNPARFYRVRLAQ